MENYWYYTLSAIPQTLAAMISLAAVFVVFKLSSITNKIAEIRKDLRRFILLVTANLDKKNYQTEIHEIEPLTNIKFLGLYQTGLDNLDPNHDTLGLEGKIFKKYSDEMFRIINSEWHSFYGPESFRVYGYLSMKRDMFKSALLVRQKSIKLLTLSLILATLTIAISLVALPNYSSSCGSVLLVEGIVSLAVISTIITGWTVWTIANSEIGN